MSRVPLVALAVALAVALGACVAPREPVEVHFDEDLEPHVRVACEAALARLPEPLARRVAGVRFRRQDLDVPAGAPALARMVASGALAYYSILSREVCITEGGASGRPRWRGGNLARAELESFLAQALPDLAATDRWRAFVAEVASWGGEPWDREPGGAAPPPGDARVIDRFVALAGRRALGGEWPLEELVLHELMHAVQLDVEELAQRNHAWSGAAGWLQADGHVTDSWTGVVFGSEHPEVLVRLVLDGQRGPCLFHPDEGHRASNRYTGYDPREDYADSGRTMAYRPEELAAAAPEKFLYLNALGWNADLDPDAPGPLWYRPRDLGEERFRRAVRAGAAALWRRAESQPDPPLDAFGAVLRAHARWLPAEDFPLLEEPVAPSDLPRPAAPPLDLSFRVDDGTLRRLPGQGLELRWDRGLEHFDDVRSFTRGMLGWLDSDEEDLAELDAETLAAASPYARYEAAWELLAEAQGTWDRARFERALEREALAQAESGRPLAGVALRVRFGEAAGQSYAACLAAGLAALPGPGPATFDGIELRAVLVELARARDPERALAIARGCEGTTWGAACRARALLRLGLPEEARAAAESITLPLLRKRILFEVSE